MSTFGAGVSLVLLVAVLVLYLLLVLAPLLIYVRLGKVVKKMDAMLLYLREINETSRGTTLR